MAIILKTNIEHYQQEDLFPNLTVIPRIGETIEVREAYKEMFEKEKLPTRLEIVGVTYKEGNVVECQLVYNYYDKKKAKLAGANLYNEPVVYNK